MFRLRLYHFLVIAYLLLFCPDTVVFSTEHVFVGNMLKEEDLISGDLDKIAERSSIKRLVARTGEKLSNLLQGQHSLGAYIEEGIVNKEAIKAVPSKTNPHPDEKKFFAAADSPITKDLRDKIDVFQIEMHKKYRNNEVQLDLFQTDYAKALANAFLKLVERYYGESFLFCNNNNN